MFLIINIFSKETPVATFSLYTYIILSLQFFNDMTIQDHRIDELSMRLGLHRPYQIMLDCLKRNAGMGDTTISHSIKTEKAKNRNSFTMTVGKQSATVIINISQLVWNEKHACTIFWSISSWLYFSVIFSSLHKYNILPEIITLPSFSRLYAKTNVMVNKKVLRLFYRWGLNVYCLNRVILLADLTFIINIPTIISFHI